MREILVLIILGYLIGGVIVQHSGMKGLSMLVAITVVPIFFSGGWLGIILGLIGVGLVVILWREKDRKII